MLCWALVEQARHKHMLDEYKNQYIIHLFSTSGLATTNFLTDSPVLFALLHMGQSTLYFISRVKYAYFVPNRTSMC